MRNFLIIFLSFLCASCSSLFPKIVVKNPVVRNSVEIESDFIPFVEEFERIVQKPVNIEMRFEIFNDLTIGVCRGFLFPWNRFKIIGIDYNWWINNKNLKREALILHELGHCMLNKWHDDDTMGEEIFSAPISLMNPTMLSDWDYRNHHIEYLKEFYGNLYIEPKSEYSAFIESDAYRPNVMRHISWESIFGNSPSLPSN